MCVFGPHCHSGRSVAVPTLKWRHFKENQSRILCTQSAWERRLRGQIKINWGRIEKANRISEQNNKIPTHTRVEKKTVQRINKICLLFLQDFLTTHSTALFSVNALQNIARQFFFSFFKYHLCQKWEYI